MLITNRKRLFYFAAFLWLILASGSASGQGACFNFVGDSVGCAPFRVVVRSCAGTTANVSYRFKWKDDDSLDQYISLPDGKLDTSFTYSSPGVYIIDQLRIGGQNLKRTVRVFDVRAKPEYRWETCTDTLIVYFTDSIFRTYEFDPGNGGPKVQIGNRLVPFRYKYNFTGLKATFPFSIKGQIPSTCNKETVPDTATLYKSNEPPSADSLIGLDTLTYRARIQTRADEPFTYQRNEGILWNDLLSGQTPRDNPNQSNLLTNPLFAQKNQVRVATQNGCGQTIPAPEWTIFWPKAIPDNQKISLSWPRISIPFMTHFQLLRNGVLLRSLYGSSDTSMIDSMDLVCGQTYCYQFLTKRSVLGHPGPLYYLSPPICVEARSNRPPDPVQFLTTTISDSGIVLKGLGSPLAKTFEVLRKEQGDEVYERILVTTTLPVTDSLADYQNKAYCYKIRYQDICGNNSVLSDSICPILLRLNTPNETDKNFQWTALEGWKRGVAKYELVRTTTSDPALTQNMGTALSYSTRQRDPVRQKVKYQIMAIAKNDTAYPQPSFSNPIINVQESKLRFPDVFTPNEDGTNETFRCYSLYISGYELKIFNAWGNVVYVSNKLSEGWDGKIDTKPAASGPYAYWATGTDEEGNKIETRGFFNLMR